MRAFLIGMGIVVISLISSLIMNDYEIAIKISGTFGIATFALAGIISGAFVSGDRIRANTMSEDKEERHRRYSWSFNLFLAGVTNVALAVVLFLLIK